MRYDRALLAALAALPLLRRRPIGYHIALLDEKADLAQATRLCTNCGAMVVRPLRLVHGVAFAGDAAVQEEITTKSRLRWLEPDTGARLHQALFTKPATPATTIPWGVEHIGAPAAWSQSRGRDVSVAVIDTGIDPDHPDLAPNLQGGANVIDADVSFADDNGHGTHVAGTVAAVGRPGGVIGVAPAADLYAVKAFDHRGGARISDIVLALQWCLEHKMQVAVMSFGAAVNSVALSQAVSLAYQRGLLMIAAAGNSGPHGGVEFPARYREVLAVGAINRDNQLARFSSRGPEVDLVGPGVRILSTVPGGGYRNMSGTSMAAPHVAGVAALAIAAGRRRSPAAMADLLHQTARPLPDLSAHEQGAGLVDAAAAV